MNLDNMDTVEFLAVYEALGQYVQNTEEQLELENDVGLRARYNAAANILIQMDARLAGLADGSKS
jgi:hypothetical protein